MNNYFKLWSETSPSIRNSLLPSLDLREWSEISENEKRKVIRHLRKHGWLVSGDAIVDCILALNDTYKYNVYGELLFVHGGPHNSYGGGYDECCLGEAMKDFFGILITQNTNVAIELLSFYAKSLIKTYYLKKRPTKADVQKAFETFDRFANAINDVFSHFAIDLSLSRQGFIPKQESIIETNAIEPMMKCINNEKWKPVQTELADAISEYHKNNEKSFSNSITHLVSALQAFLQIRINGKIGKGDIDLLIRKGIGNGKLPNDELSKKVMKGLQSTLMEYRQKQGDAHPKDEYANAKSVRLVLNLVAIFIQHCC